LDREPTGRSCSTPAAPGWTATPRPAGCATWPVFDQTDHVPRRRNSTAGEQAPGRRLHCRKIHGSNLASGAVPRSSRECLAPIRLRVAANPDVVPQRAQRLGLLRYPRCPYGPSRDGETWRKPDIPGSRGGPPDVCSVVRRPGACAGRQLPAAAGPMRRRGAASGRTLMRARLAGATLHRGLGPALINGTHC